jgi:hypothetical protein
MERTRTIVVALACAFLILAFSAALAAAEPASKTAPDQPGVQLSGADLYRAMTTEAIDEVDRRAREREWDRLKVFGLVGAVLIALVAFFIARRSAELRRAVLRDLREEVPNDPSLRRVIDGAVQAAVIGDLDKKLVQIKKEFAYFRLSNLASSLADPNRKGFTPGERDAIVLSLGTLKEASQIVGPTEVSASLEKIVDTFCAADLPEDVDRLDEALGDIAEQARGICHTMVQHYGMRVIGTPQADEQTKRRFSKYAQACKRHNRQCVALPFALVAEYAHQEPGWETRVADALFNAQYFADQEKAAALRLLDDYSDAKVIAREPSAQLERVAHWFREFCGRFQSELERLHPAADWAKQGEAHSFPMADN